MRKLTKKGRKKNQRKQSGGNRASIDGPHYQAAIATQEAIRMLVFGNAQYVANHCEDKSVDDILVVRSDGKDYYQAKDEKLDASKIKEILGDFYTQFSTDIGNNEKNNNYILVSTDNNKDFVDILDAITKIPPDTSPNEFLQKRLTEVKYKKLLTIQEELSKKSEKEDLGLIELVKFFQHVGFTTLGKNEPEKSARDILNAKELPLTLYSELFEKMMGAWRGQYISKIDVEKLLEGKKRQMGNPFKVKFFFQVLDKIKAFLKEYKSYSVKEVEEFLKELAKDTNSSWHFFNLIEDPELLDLISNKLIKPLLENPIDKSVKGKIIEYLKTCQKQNSNTVLELIDIFEKNTENFRFLEAMLDSFEEYQFDPHTLEEVYKIAKKLVRHPNPFVREKIAKLSRKIAEKDLDKSIYLIEALIGYHPDPKDLTMGGPVLAFTFQGKDLENRVHEEILNTLTALIPHKKSNESLEKLLNQETEDILDEYYLARSEAQRKFLKEMGVPTSLSEEDPLVSTTWEETEDEDDEQEIPLASPQKISLEDALASLTANPYPYSQEVSNICKLVEKDPTLLEDWLKKNDLSKLHKRIFQSLIHSYLKGVDNDINSALSLAEQIPDLTFEEIGLDISRTVFEFILKIQKENKTLSKVLTKKIEIFLERTIIPSEVSPEKSDPTPRAGAALTEGINSVRGVGIEILYLLLRFTPKDKGLLKKLIKAAEEGDSIMKCVINYRIKWILRSEMTLVEEIIQKTQSIGSTEINHSLAGALAYLRPNEFKKNLQLIRGILETDNSKHVQEVYGEIIGYRLTDEDYGVDELAEDVIKHRLGTIDCYLGLLHAFMQAMPSLIEGNNNVFLGKFKEMVLRAKDWKVPQRASHLFIAYKLDHTHFHILKGSGLFDVFLEGEWINYIAAHHDIVTYLKRCFDNGINSSEIVSMINHMLTKGSPMLNDSSVAKSVADIVEKILEKEGEQSPVDVVTIFDAALKIGWPEFYQIYEKYEEIIKRMATKL